MFCVETDAVWSVKQDLRFAVSLCFCYIFFIELIVLLLAIQASYFSVMFGSMLKLN